MQGKKKEEAEPKEMQGLGGMEGGGAAGVRGRATMRAQTSLFGMQIISEFLISINAWATLNAFNFQSRQAE